MQRAWPRVLFSFQKLNLGEKFAEFWRDVWFNEEKVAIKLKQGDGRRARQEKGPGLSDLRDHPHNLPKALIGTTVFRRPLLQRHRPPIPPAPPLRQTGWRRKKIPPPAARWYVVVSGAKNKLNFLKPNPTNI